MKCPTLSVIVPNFNHSRFLPESLEAILTQSHQPTEVIVVDDASTDSSCQIVEQYQQRFPFLNLIRQMQNLGPAETMNRGIKEAKGDYIALCAADDIVQPLFFKRCLEILMQHPEVAFCSGDFYRFIDQKPYQFERQFMLPFEKYKMMTPSEFVNICAQSSFYIPSQTTIYRRELILRYGSLKPELQSLCDFYLNCQMALRHPIVYIPESMGAYRVVDAGYARAMRFQLRQREKMCNTLMRFVEGEEKEFQEALKKSGILAHAGIYMIAFLTWHPKYWGYLPSAFKKRFLS